MVTYLTIKNIFKIHIFFYIAIFICLITGNIRDYLIFTTIILIHELGHITAGKIFKWKIKKIILLPFGGLTIFDNPINTSLLEELVVAIMGPIFQTIFFIIINKNFNLTNNIIYYNYTLLFFNLLPIYPLDGSKILYILLCTLLPFKYCIPIMIFISINIIMIIVIMLRSFDLIIILILSFLLYNCIKLLKNKNNIFNKFLLERYVYNLKFKHIKKIKSIDKMYLWCRHLFYNGKRYISEHEKLSKMFDK